MKYLEKDVTEDAVRRLWIAEVSRAYLTLRIGHTDRISPRYHFIVHDQLPAAEDVKMSTAAQAFVGKAPVDADNYLDCALIAVASERLIRLYDLVPPGTPEGAIVHVAETACKEIPKSNRLITCKVDGTYLTVYWDLQLNCYDRPEAQVWLLTSLPHKLISVEAPA